MDVDVSIIIPTYNRFWSLPKTIESCKNSICKTEIIVIDDGSSDGTLDWLLGQKDITVLTQKNQGKCWAVNYGISIAKGKYIKFLDSDDMLAIGSIDEQFSLTKYSSCDIVVSGYQVIDEHDHLLRSQPWIVCDDFIAQQLGECDSSHYSSYLFKKSFINDIPHRPDFEFRDDRLFVLEAALKKPKVVVHSGTALKHRTHSKQRLQFNFGLRHAVQNYQHIRIYQKISLQLETMGELTNRRKQAMTKILWPLAHWIAKDNIEEAVKVYQWIKELDPQFVIPSQGFSSKLYRLLGFKTTEVILKMRRFFKYGIN